MKIAYKDHKFNAKSLKLLGTAEAIIKEYQAQGFDLTLRQLYYQMVARAIIPNSQREYSRLGRLISEGRLAGHIDWDAIVDRTRSVQSVGHWGDPESIVHSAYEAYKIDKWQEQPYRPEVWIEKNALAGVISPICRELDVGYLACVGYVSQSAMWRASNRMNRYRRKKQVPVILHLGDHDPSGIDMSRDIRDRMYMFEVYGLEFDRLALNMDQVEQYDPPPNPTKLTDSRAKDYMYNYGDDSWELDALEPKVIVALIETAVLDLRDGDLWKKYSEREEEERKALKGMAENYDAVAEFLVEEYPEEEGET